ncbi:hypothetical protein HJC23_008759 [Cyclotella cryptica]|uniref:Uncharacterized protein n=1 Tax=Cyclotella cryptica TaxID=29204 RepID=A0ABD3PEY4_9STRA|eukprot:CCRYP_015685-RA/>CCRYP_015685-RA protein AED:0.18 eAED:0.18 QI:0/-1/0/1/-1/1/1/0/515
MADEDLEKLSIINDIIRLESSTNEALRSSRDEIERLESIANEKKETVRELENELKALLDAKKKKKRKSRLRNNPLRRMTISCVAGEGPHAPALRRRSDNLEMSNPVPTEGSELMSYAGIACNRQDDDGASVTFTVATFDKDDLDLCTIWDSCQQSIGEGDVSSFHGGSSAVSNGISHVHVPSLIAREMISQKQALLSTKQSELAEYQQKYTFNSKKLSQLKNQLTALQRQQNSRCEEHNCNIASLSKTKKELIARIRWREDRILEEEKKLAELKRRLEVARCTKEVPQCKHHHPAELSPFKSNKEVNLSSETSLPEKQNQVTALTKECADMFTDFSCSIFNMIESTITLPSLSSISYSISEISTDDLFPPNRDTKGVTNTQNCLQRGTANPTSHEHQFSIGNEPSQLGNSPSESKQKDSTNEQKLNEFEKSKEQYDVKIRLLQNEIKSFMSSHKEETETNNAILRDLESQISMLNDRFLKRGNEIRRLIDEVEMLDQTEKELLQVINGPKADGKD